MKCHNSYIFSIVVSILLATIVSCSSVKKTKSITKEEIKEKTELKVDSSKTISKEETNISSINSVIKKEILDIKYEPEFDLKGNLIPFSFKATDKTGKETNVSIQGKASVVYKTDVNEVNELKEENKNLQHNINVLYNRLYELEKKTDTKQKDKQVSPDYFKYIIWLGAGFVFLIGVIIVLYFYFKNTLGKYKKLIGL